MMKNKKLVIVSIVLALIIFIGASYAFVRLTLTGTKTYSIVGGELSLVLDESNNGLTIGQDDAIPVSDYAGMQQEGYNFTITNNGKADINYSLYIDDNEDKTMADEAIRYALRKGDTTTSIIGEFSELPDRLIATGNLKRTESVTYNLKFWIGVNATNNQVVGKLFSVKLRVVGEQIVDLVYQDDSGAAAPVLKNGLIPITIKDGIAYKANLHEKWYDYDESIWANAVIVRNGKETEYTNLAAGSEIKEEDIESYFVWIPKYDYQIFDMGTYTGLTTLTDKTQIINVRFSSNNTTDNDTECNYPVENNQAVSGATGTCQVGKWMTHPAFTTMNVTGFWVGKFETGYDGATSTATAQSDTVDTSKIIIKPNVYSWRGITVGKIFKNSYDYNRELDSHMMKNTESAAVAYLSTSKYGYKDEISTGTKRTIAIINNNSAYITGYASTEEPTVGYNASSISGNRQESTTLGNDGTYTKNYLNTYSGLASTTGNYSGVYDTSGGAWEYVAGYTTGAGSGKDLSGITSLYSGFYSDSNYAKYWDKYTTNATNAYTYNNRILGDGTAEFGPFQATKDPDGNSRYKSSWNNDYAHFVASSSPWFRRGAYFPNGIGAGSFAFYDDSGAVRTLNSFRVALAP